MVKSNQKENFSQKKIIVTFEPHFLLRDCFAENIGESSSSFNEHCESQIERRLTDITEYIENT